MRIVDLAGAGRATTQLGFGCAYLGPGSGYLLNAAYDAGIRHFDVAQSYGHGLTEGYFGRSRPGRAADVTITTKFGLLPDKGSRLRHLVRRYVAPALGRLRRDRTSAAPARRPADLRPGRHKAPMTADYAAAAVAQSLTALRRRRIDVLLLHEADAFDLQDPGLLEQLGRWRADDVIGAFGIGGDARRMPALLADRADYCQVVQHDWSPRFAPARLGDRPSILYRTYDGEVADVANVILGDPTAARRWSEAVGADLAEPGAFRQLVFKAALELRPADVILFSSTNEKNIAVNVAIAGDAALAEPALRLASLIRREFPLEIADD